MKSILLASVLIAIAVPAAAQQTARPPANPLQELCTSFMEQSGQAVSGDRNKLCTCLVNETQARLTRQEMEIYAKANETGQPPPQAIMDKVIGVATTCLTTAR